MYSKFVIVVGFLLSSLFVQTNSRILHHDRNVMCSDCKYSEKTLHQVQSKLTSPLSTYINTKLNTNQYKQMCQ